jgi:dihydrofolate synthase/folylpolyglutamate synthase
LPGDHQIDNAGMALATVRLLRAAGLRLGERAIGKGLVTVEWPARLQRLTQGPLVERLPAGWEFWIDGGHNAAAGEMLARHAAGWLAERPELPIRLVFGMLDTKQPVEFLRPLAGVARDIVCVPIGGGHHSLTAEAMVAAAKSGGFAAAGSAASIAAAIDALVAADLEPARLLVCGSLYFAGEVLAENG